MYENWYIVPFFVVSYSIRSMYEALSVKWILLKHKIERYRACHDKGQCQRSRPYISLQGWKNTYIYQIFLRSVWNERKCQGWRYNECWSERLRTTNGRTESWTPVNEPAHYKTNTLTSASSEDSNQPRRTCHFVGFFIQRLIYIYLTPVLKYAKRNEYEWNKTYFMTVSSYSW